MLFLFKHKSNQTQGKHNAKQDKIAESIAKECTAAQHKASKVLQDWFEMLSMTAKRFAVVSFCIVSISSSVFLILKSFSKHSGSPFSFTTISVAKQAESNVHSTQVFGVITKMKFEKIIKFRVYLDSLFKSETGRIKLDSIMKNRPGLIDSLTKVEKIYQLQSPNK